MMVFEKNNQPTREFLRPCRAPLPANEFAHSKGFASSRNYGVKDVIFISDYLVIVVVMYILT